jgi:hypothetical protein
LKKLPLLVFILLFTISPIALTTRGVLSEPETLFAERIPVRQEDSPNGFQFARKTPGMKGAERPQAALAELLQGTFLPFSGNLNLLDFDTKVQTA